tara:strand:- start:31 stop:273 length:243 start_codon:yes stop_codon:yes gene_type:complete
VRNYKKEYSRYHSSPLQKKNRASRNAARNALKKRGVVKKGDNKDINHKNGNPRDNRRLNLGITTKKANRSFPRNRNAGKR